MIVKVCGITSPGDATLARGAGADLVGLNFVSGPRRIQPADATGIVAALDDPSRVVSLVNVGDAQPDWLAIADAMAAIGTGYVQLYGSVDSSTLRRVRELGLASIWVGHVGTDGDLTGIVSRLRAFGRERPDYLLLDTCDPSRLGGTGRMIDSAALAASIGSCPVLLPPIFLAGGLTPANVAGAIRQVEPVGVDVSSGVESSPGRKDPDKLRAFVSAAHPGA